MPQVGFEPTIPVFERAKMVHALHRAATVIGGNLHLVNVNSQFYFISYFTHIYAQNIYENCNTQKLHDNCTGGVEPYTSIITVLKGVWNVA
jgi:hypothetical protein